MSGKLTRCIECDSEDLVEKEKDFTFQLPNPRSIKVRQRCTECSNCGKSYFDNDQANELSDKILKKTKAI